MMMRPVLGSVLVTGIKKPDVNQKSSISIYPNPGHGKYFINSEQPVLNVEVINLTGQQVNARFDQNTIEIINRTTGVYIFKITTSDGTFLEKVVLKP